VNYFGMVATLEGLRPLLAKSAAPRAVAVSSLALIWPVNDDLVVAFKAGDEDRAVSIADSIADSIGGGDPSGPISSGGGTIYFSSKRALVNWVRRTAPTSGWAGAGIALNVIAPGMIITPMTMHTLDNEESRKASEAAIPRPLNGSAGVARQRRELPPVRSVDFHRRRGRSDLARRGRVLSCYPQQPWIAAPLTIRLTHIDTPEDRVRVLATNLLNAQTWPSADFTVLYLHHQRRQIKEAFKRIEHPLESSHDAQRSALAAANYAKSYPFFAN
jgi:hypothetical protein